MPIAGGNSLAILIPVFNDWESVRLLLPLLDEVLSPTSWSATICIVDDGSCIPVPADWTMQTSTAIESVEILHLRRNLGHQRAIAVGLCHVHESFLADAVVVMDGGGEDRPADIVKLLNEFDHSSGKYVIFAERTKRMEGVMFQLFYSIYRWTHLLMTGISVRVGNFSVIPPIALNRLMVVSELWNHYAAAVFRARIPFRTVPLPKGKRLTGESKMNFVNLVVHGLSAMSVFSDQMSVRVLIGATAMAIALALAAIFTNSGSVWSALNLIFEVLMISVLLIFTVIGGRNHLGFLPIRDARYFIMSKTMIFTRASSLERLAGALEQSGPANLTFGAPLSSTHAFGELKS